MDLLSAIRRCALWDVISSEDDEFRLRRIYRWYSKTFHTPLHEAETLPIAYVLQHFYEDYYGQMFEDDKLEALEEERIILTENEDERKVRERKELEEKMGDEEFLKKAREEEEMKQKRKGDSILPVIREQTPAFGEPIQKKTIGDVIQEGKLDEGVTFSFEEDKEPEDLDKVW